MSRPLACFFCVFYRRNVVGGIIEGYVLGGRETTALNSVSSREDKPQRSSKPR